MNFRNELENYIKEVLIPAAKIEKRVNELARQISSDYIGKTPLIVGILKGAVFFVSDLLRRLSIPVKVDFMAVSSYEGTETTGEVKILKDLDMPIMGEHVILVEDIVDTGLTMARLIEILEARHPASLRVCALLDKPSRRKVDVPIHYIGFEIPDYFVVGYGLDYNQMFRNLPYIGVLDLDSFESNI